MDCNSLYSEERPCHEDLPRGRKRQLRFIEWACVGQCRAPSSSSDWQPYPFLRILGEIGTSLEQRKKRISLESFWAQKASLLVQSQRILQHHYLSRPSTWAIRGSGASLETEGRPKGNKDAPLFLSVLLFSFPSLPLHLSLPLSAPPPPIPPT